MNIESAKYEKDIQENNCSITAVINGETISVPLDPNNRHYAEIIKQVEAEELTIAAAE